MKRRRRRRRKGRNWLVHRFNGLDDGDEDDNDKTWAYAYDRGTSTGDDFGRWGGGTAKWRTEEEEEEWSRRRRRMMRRP